MKKTEQLNKIKTGCGSAPTLVGGKKPGRGHPHTPTSTLVLS